MRIFSKKYMFLFIIFIVTIALFGCSNDDKEVVNNKDVDKPNTSEENNVSANTNNINENENTNNKTNNNQSGEEVAENSEPWDYDGDSVTLKFRIGVDDETFAIRYKDLVEENFPNIELELVQSGYHEDAMQELFASGIIPDLHVGRAVDYLVDEYDYLEPADPYLEEHNFDLNVYPEGMIESQRASDPLGNDDLYGLPIEGSVFALFYNKAIFDKFGVPYPEDGMTWEEILDITRSLTREDDGIEYRGLLIEGPSVLFSQYSMQATDPETGEVLFAEDEHTKSFFNFLDAFRSIPGIYGGSSEEDTTAHGFENNNRNIAMVVRNTPWLELFIREEDFNFDMVTVPHFEGMEDTGPTWGPLILSVPKPSENKEAAWAVAAYLTSEEAQTHLSQIGSPTALDNHEVIEQFAINNLKEVDGTYNYVAPFEQKPSALPAYSKYDEPFEGFIQEKGTEFMWAGPEVDVVTFLREMNEEYKLLLEEIKGNE